MWVILSILHVAKGLQTEKLEGVLESLEKSQKSNKKLAPIALHNWIVIHCPSIERCLKPLHPFWSYQ